MALDGVEVRALPTEARAGAMNMALDAVAAETVSAGGPASVRVYGWQPSTLSLGYAQASETVDWGYCEGVGIDVTRRPTGGGGIYHDAVGDIAYSIVAPRDALPGDLLEAYERLCSPVVAAFERMGVPVRFADAQRPAALAPACYLREINPAHDLVVGAKTTARKISGNAQHRRRDAVVQHGSLLYSNRVERHLACFADCPIAPATFRERVTAIDEHVAIDRSAAVATLEATLREWAAATAGEWSAAERDRAAELVAEKFGNDGWIRRRIDPRAEG